MTSMMDHPGAAKRTSDLDVERWTFSVERLLSNCSARRNDLLILHTYTADGAFSAGDAGRVPRLGRLGSRNPSMGARLITRTPSCLCSSAICAWNCSIFVQCTFGRKLCSA